MSTPLFRWLRSILGSGHLMMPLVSVACAGPEFSATPTPDSGGARVDARGDANLEPIIVYFEGGTAADDSARDVQQDDAGMDRGLDGSSDATVADSAPNSDVSVVDGATLGTPCIRGTQCATGNCVDGYCCDKGCTGACQACDVTGAQGTCTVVPSGQPHGSRAPCAGAGTACGGSCQGIATCTFPTTGCAVRSCSAGVMYSQASCDGAGACNPQVQTRCNGFACTGSACFSSCSSDAQCMSPTPYCDSASQTCLASAPLGHTCAAGIACQSGTSCVNGFCCGTASCPICQACGPTGSCTAVTNGTACGSAGTCSGGACTCPTGQLLCGAACGLSAPQCKAPFSEYPVTVANSLLEMTAGPDGNLWFTDSTNGKIARITTNGTISEFTVGGTPQAITVGPDGNLWFTDSGANKIGTINTSGGGLVEYQATGPFGPNQIITGPPSTATLWFTQRGGQRLGRITTSGSLSEFGAPSVGKPTGIAVGSDGAIWFTEPDVDKIARVTPDGITFTEYPLGTTGNGLGFMVRGPDGNVWFSEFLTNKIGFITTAGAITEIPLAASSGPESLTVGVDNNIWFTEFDGSKIARRASNGSITEYSIPTPASSPEGIATGADGNIWYTGFASGKVGRFLVCCTQ